MSNITQISKNLQHILLEKADEKSKEIGLIKRQRKLSGRTFLQMLVLGFQSNPHASYTDLAISAATVGVQISPQGIEQRFTQKAAEFLNKLLAESIRLSVESQRTEVEPLLAKFNGVYLQDSTIVSLPEELAYIWQGCGGSLGGSAGLKLQVHFEYTHGILAGITMQDAKTQDQASPYQNIDLPPGALRIEDLGYFSLQRMQKDQEQGVFWVSRLKTGINVYDEKQTELDLVKLLEKTKKNQLEMKVYLGKEKRVHSRLLIRRAPDEVVAQRLRKLRRQAVKQGRTLSKRQKFFARWTLYITNVPEEKLSFEEVCLLYRVRWQIELLFKLWKSYFKIDQWRSQNPWRILCELYAKLIGAVISQWLFSFLWQYSHRSFFKASSVIREYAPVIAINLDDLERLNHTIERMILCFGVCRTNSRKSKPAAYQLINDPSLLNLM